MAVHSDSASTPEINSNVTALYNQLNDTVKDLCLKFLNVVSSIGYISGVSIIIAGVGLFNKEKFKPCSISLMIAGIITILVYMYINIVYPIYLNMG